MLGSISAFQQGLVTYFDRWVKEVQFFKEKSVLSQKGPDSIIYLDVKESMGWGDRCLLNHMYFLYWGNKSEYEGIKIRWKGWEEATNCSATLNCVANHCPFPIWLFLVQIVALLVKDSAFVSVGIEVFGYLQKLTLCW